MKHSNDGRNQSIDEAVGAKSIDRSIEKEVESPLSIDVACVFVVLGLGCLVEWSAVVISFSLLSTPVVFWVRTSRDVKVTTNQTMIDLPHQRCNQSIDRSIDWLLTGSDKLFKPCCIEIVISTLTFATFYFWSWGTGSILPNLQSNIACNLSFPNHLITWETHMKLSQMHQVHLFFPIWNTLRCIQPFFRHSWQASSSEPNDFLDTGKSVEPWNAVFGCICTVIIIIRMSLCDQLLSSVLLLSLNTLSSTAINSKLSTLLKHVLKLPFDPVAHSYPNPNFYFIFLLFF